MLNRIILPLSLILFSSITIFSSDSFAKSSEKEKNKKVVSDSKTNKLTWLSIEEGFKKSKKEKKPLIVDFFTTWCPSCTKMDEVTYSNKKIIKNMNKYFITSKVDCDSEKKFMYENEQITGVSFLIKWVFHLYQLLFFLMKLEKLLIL